MSRTETLPSLYVGLLKLDDLDRVQRPIYRAYVASPLTAVPKRWRRVTEKAREMVKDRLASSRFIDFSVYDPSDHTSPGSGHAPDEVFEINRREIATADLLFVCHTTPADGIGVEFGLAINHRVPAVAVHPCGQPMTRLLLVENGLRLPPINFTNIAELRRRLDGQMSQVAQVTVEGRAHRRQLKGSGWAAHLGRLVVKARMRNAWSRADLARRCRLNPIHVKGIELFEDVALGLSNADMQSLLQCIDHRISLRPGTGIVVPEFDADSEIVIPELRTTWNQSLESIADFTISDVELDDQRVMRIWGAYHEMITEGIAGRESFGVPMTVQRWRELYDLDDGRLL